ncbi:MAG TPA: DNA methyltransferase [Candidatus Ozemobacteraceae bacterium]|nr:DNA methyltransferase [Candidatus Ozemobacteraceae bacterium]
MTALSLARPLAPATQTHEIDRISTPQGPVPRIYDEFWTAKQRQMHSLHYAVSYRASFKPELPDYFIRRLTRVGDTVADPFGGRGTTALQAALLGRRAISNDINPLSERITSPKLNPVTPQAIEERLAEIPFRAHRDLSKEEDLSMFYHPDTFLELVNLKNYLKRHRDPIDRFIEMVAISRLHGHSPGFFSAYSFPQISIPKANQVKINRTRGVEPEYRDIASRILKKGKSILKDGGVEEIRRSGLISRFTTNDSRKLKDWETGSVNLVVTSPPFLNQVDYIQDSWLEMWFCDIDSDKFRNQLVQTASLDEWKQFISDTLSELHRVLVPGGYLAMEVGEVRHQGELLNLEEVIINMTCNKQYNAGQYRVLQVLVQSQEFTKLANCFQVKNNVLGTNTNRIILMEKIASPVSRR